MQSARGFPNPSVVDRSGPGRPPWPPWPAQRGPSPVSLPAEVDLRRRGPPEPPGPAPREPRRSRGFAVPNLVPALATIGVFAAWAFEQSGYPVSAWAPGSLLIFALLTTAIWRAREAVREAPRAVLAAIALLAAYTAFSYLSILWAGSPGDAYEGATRTLLYLGVFVLFTLWRSSATSSALLLSAWTGAIVVVCGVELVRLVASADPSAMFVSGRLSLPSGYPNAEAAQWLMAFWPAVALAGWRRAHPALRGVATAGGVALAGVALMSQSRGAVLALPLTALVFFAIVPGRLRSLAVLSVVAAAAGAAAPALLHVGTVLGAPGTIAADQAAVHSAVEWLVVAAVVAGFVVGTLSTALERRADDWSTIHRAELGRLRLLGWAGMAIAVLAGLVVLVSGHRLQNAWHSFTHGYSAQAQTGSRLLSGLGSNRYDFYRVAWSGFTAHPVGGLGADNFQALYLTRGRGPETPRYPHSIELRTLEQTGLVGALLLGGAILAALAAAWQATRRRGRDHGALIAAAALMPFAYWLIHGSFDWFWEFAGLGAPAFAMLGLACSLAPARSSAVRGRGRAWSLGVSAAGAVLLVGMAVFATTWVSQREISDAVHTWSTRPALAYAELHRAAQLDPLSDQPELLAGTIATREGDLARARAQFSEALTRSSQDEYATLELGALDSATGDRAGAQRLLQRAVQLSPRDSVARAALILVQQGGVVDPTKLNRAIYHAGAALAG